MVTAQVREIARQVRVYVKRQVRSENCEGFINKATLAGACAMASWELVLRLRAAGIACQFVNGEYDGAGHCWVQIGDYDVVDITATQFGVKDKVYVTTYADDTGYRAWAFDQDALELTQTWPIPQQPRA